MRSRVLFAAPITLAALADLDGCSRAPPKAEPAAAAPYDAGATTFVSAEIPVGGELCPTPKGSPRCFHFKAPEDAFRWVIAKNPAVLAVGEAHAQKGTEDLASSTKRFTETFLPLLAPRASDVVVELWAPNPKCMKQVKQVASAQKPVTDVQAATNKNEYETLGIRAKEAGVTPWLLSPTCDDFSMLADAGDDVVGSSLGLIKRLTQARITQLYQRNLLAAPAPSPAPGRDGVPALPDIKMVVGYGGALHNDLVPAPEMKEFSFGPELDALTKQRYIELDLIVPEYVKKTDTWQKLPWYPAFEADRGGAGDKKPYDKATLFLVGERSFVLVFPDSGKG